jgi:type I restriction enzyme S subunit
MIDYNVIPKSWKPLKLGEVCIVRNGYAFKSADFTNNGVLLFRQTNLDGENVKLKNAVYLPQEYLEKFKEYKIVKGDVLVGMSGSIGKMCVYNLDKPALQNQRTGLLRFTDLVEKKFIRYYFEVLEQVFVKKSKGVAVLNISAKDIQESEFHLPSLSEQQAIVAKIEKLLSELENGKQQLKTAQQKLKVYRQSLLKWAFVNTKFNDFVMKEVTEKIQIGPFGTQLHKEDYVTNGIPLINPMHIQDGNIQPNFSYSITKQKRDSLPNYILKEGDVIMGRRGEMGRCGLVRKKEIGWFCGTGSLYFRPQTKKLNSLFLYYYLSSQTVKKYLDENAGGTTMANLNLKIVNDIPISLPSLKEQQLIVDELESKLTVCDKIDETISQSLQQVETLRQSILKKAFEGKLLNQLKENVSN